jgi:hypothetical protein
VSGEANKRSIDLISKMKSKFFNDDDEEEDEDEVSEFFMSFYFLVSLANVIKLFTAVSYEFL